MSDTMRKASGVQVRIIDLGNYSDFMTWGGIILPNGDVRLICHEGVSWLMNDKSDFALQTQWGFENLDAVKSAINHASASMDVAHLVRVFGARLDNNVDQFVWTVKQASN